MANARLAPRFAANPSNKPTEQHTSMKHVGRNTLCGLLLVAFARTALAIINPCSLIGGASFPDHPMPIDLVPYQSQFAAVPPVRPITAQEIVLTRQRTGPGNVITIEVIVTDDATPFPGYQAATDQRQLQEVVVPGVLGPLAAGSYVVTTIWRRYTAGTGFVGFGSCGLEVQHESSFQIFATPGTAPVVEFYHAGLDHYFMTRDIDEIRALDTGVFPGWIRTGQSFATYLPGQTNNPLSPVSRFYGRSGSGLTGHFFTIDIAELAALLIGPLATAWEVETLNAFQVNDPDVQTGACQNGTIPVYRLWNGRVDSDHRYTTDPTIKQEMIQRGYMAEGYGPHGVVMCAVR
jgi:uncharacterized protein DUF5648